MNISADSVSTTPERAQGAPERLLGNSYFPWLASLLVLFVLRVLGQLVQQIRDVSFLPSLEAWQGSSLPYPALLTSQVIIVFLMLYFTLMVRRNRFPPLTWIYVSCFYLGGAYFGVMAFRFVAGLTFLSENSWFSKVLPAFFHVVLASYILLFGHYIFKKKTAQSTGLAGKRDD